MRYLHLYIGASASARTDRPYTSHLFFRLYNHLPDMLRQLSLAIVDRIIREDRRQQLDLDMRGIDAIIDLKGFVAVFDGKGHDHRFRHNGQLQCARLEGAHRVAFAARTFRLDDLRVAVLDHLGCFFEGLDS